MPTEKQAATLLEKVKTAGTGYCINGKCFPAHIDPIFSDIGGGSWIWIKGQASSGMSSSYNLNQAVPVPIPSDGTKYPARMFAVREARCGMGQTAC